MHAPVNNYFIAKSKGGLASAKMVAELGKPGALWGNTVSFSFVVINRIEILLKGARSARLRGGDHYLSEGKM